MAGGHFDPIKACRCHALSGIGVGLDYFPDIIGGHGPRHGVKTVIRNRRRRIRHTQQTAIAMGDTATMGNLAKDLGTMFMDRLGDLAVAGNTLIRAGVDVG